MKNRKYLVASLFIALALAGCASDEAVKPAGDGSGAAPAQTAPADSGAASGSALSDRERQRRAELLAQKRVHFAFDSSTIDDEARAIIEAHSSHLVSNPQLKVTLEGNCDERGTREYNLALGERRAQAVERMMKVLGVAGSRIKTVSYGEEKPLCQEHDESCWRQNRRAEIGY
ncbi:peptidoglycan-associated lipoprotein [Sulfuricaulis limicola]|uniref:Peptidoglycan-associated lipoprotein n=1 Tax=Sulfuricaulis limicola TaxID=1620215 RepID=A0A1B4XIB2_9GAMM|nr:peptidoglycan-associated lipoprotein Pal [Sulfuricaulis limicola]BAV34536.1 peptidoglycan-associated lipoprotein [Sulfuricaulis limicola]